MTLQQKLDWLIDQWCDRRALRPLHLLLRAYPAVLAHTDQFGDVLNSLRDVQGQCQSELTPKELVHVLSAIVELEDFMKQQHRA